jgi:hypothetical protein
LLYTFPALMLVHSHLELQSSRQMGSSSPCDDCLCFWSCSSLWSLTLHDSDSHSCFAVINALWRIFFPIFYIKNCLNNYIRS